MGNDYEYLMSKGTKIRQYSHTCFPFVALGDVDVRPFDSEKVRRDNREIYEDEFHRWLKYAAHEKVKINQAKVKERMLSRHRLYPHWA